MDLVHRQQELRLRLLNAAYKAFVHTPSDYVDVAELNLIVPPDVARVPLDADDDASTLPVDFTTDPINQTEIRAAVYYLVERQLLTMMPPDVLEKSQIPASSLHIHITANGVDAFEGFVTTSEARASERPVGFNCSPVQPQGFPLARAIPGSSDPPNRER
jgi:hypothetical protein